MSCERETPATDTEESPMSALIDLVDLDAMPARRLQPRADVLALCNAALDLLAADPAAAKTEIDRIRFRLVGRRSGRGIAVRRDKGYADADLEVTQAAAGHIHTDGDGTRPDFRAQTVDQNVLDAAIREAARRMVAERGF
jgi:hypothetical protein